MVNFLRTCLDFSLFCATTIEPILMHVYAYEFFIKVSTELYRPTEVGIKYNNVAFHSNNYIISDVKEVK